ncbi:MULTISPECIES: porin family protein [Flavobacterium]|uniref:PorT family protein n=1 Tax=Flavobacterium ranwuense TaxID=2541725 RepID=A0ABY2DNN2_9FLAO|nr:MULTISPECIES: porin family protein [Flavobacterium]TDE27717.1 PorT family protein [Flavobacterium ranwuense]TDE53729.1 PorT family protein [Flavobacterium sp. GT3P67]
MKKTILVTVLLLAISSTMQAQLVKFGIKAGLNYANQTGSEITINSTNYNKKDAITSYHAGLVAEIKLTDGFSVQPELLYSTQGASYENAGEEFKNELGYLSIPVLAKFHLNKTVSLDLGPQASFLLSERNDFDVKNAETFEFGVAGGLGFNITKNFFLQGRYVLGLTEASKEAEVKNSVLQISAGFTF